MSLLTKEQAAHVAYMRDLYCGPSGYDEIDELVCIIDDLQARAPKQYTEQELNAVFESMPIADLFPPIQEEHIIGKVAWHSWKVCARFLGALKVES